MGWREEEERTDVGLGMLVLKEPLVALLKHLLDGDRVGHLLPRVKDSPDFGSLLEEDRPVDSPVHGGLEDVAVHGLDTRHVRSTASKRRHCSSRTQPPIVPNKTTYPSTAHAASIAHHSAA